MWNKQRKGSRYQPCLAPELGRVHVKHVKWLVSLYAGVKLMDIGKSHRGGLRCEAACFFDGCKPRTSLCGARASGVFAALKEKLCGMSRTQVSSRRWFGHIAER